MSFSNPYSPFLFISALLALITALIVWPRRTAPGALPLFLMLLTTVVWAGGNGMFLETNDPGARIFWFNFLLAGSLMGTPAFFAFGVQFTNREHWLTPRNILLISLIPLFCIILGWTTEYHGLFYQVRDFNTRLPNGGWNLIPGTFYWIYVCYAYVMVLFTLWILAQAYVQSPKAYRGQIGAIMIGTLIPFLGNIFYTLIIGVGKSEVDPTPFLFAVMGVIYAHGLFWYHLFSVAPVARHTLVEHMQDGVIVVDAQNRVVDVNPSALRWMKWTRSSPVGMDIQELFKTWFDEFHKLPVHLYAQTEIRSSGTSENYFDLRVEPLMGKENVLTGRLITFRDITRQKQSEMALLDAHDRLRLQYKEIEMLRDELREQAIRDPLTGLFNRRYMEETLERELARAIRDESAIGICMADIDNFKSFNDQHGHKAGDLILQTVANIFTKYSRAEDVVCRYGGEEFLVLMPGADLDVTSRRAEDWRRAFEQSKIEFEGKLLSTTLSLGVAIFPEQGRTSDEVLKLADEAMYLSKRQGKNQVNIARAWG